MYTSNSSAAAEGYTEKKPNEPHEPFNAAA